MNNILKFHKLSYLNITKYDFKNSFSIDFRNEPRTPGLITYILKGSVDIYFDDEVVSAKENEIIFFPAGCTYLSKWHGSPIVFYSTAFIFEEPNPLPNITHSKIQKITDIDCMREKVEKLLFEYNRETQSEFNLVSAFYSMLGIIHPLLKYTPTKPIDSKIEKAITYLEQNFADVFSVEHLARLCNMSLSNFYARFKETTGMSPIEYKQNAMVKKAKVLLSYNHKISAEQICEQLDINSVVYFRRVFKKLTGTTPTEYQKFQSIGYI